LLCGDGGGLAASLFLPLVTVVVVVVGCGGCREVAVGDDGVESFVV